MKGRDVINELHRKLGNGSSLTEGALATKLGMSPMGLLAWKKQKKTLSPRQIVGLVDKAMKTAEASAHQNAIKPIIEFFDLEAQETLSGKKYEIFSPKQAEDHPYLGGLKDELKSNHGVYIFYDSRGRALYVGKALQLNLWDELKNAFNRNRGVQKIKRVEHPGIKVPFKTSEEKRRQIYGRAVPLYELATYLSVYSIPTGLINMLEALLVRGFANDLLNVRMEHFAGRGGKKTKAQKAGKRRKKS